LTVFGELFGLRWYDARLYRYVTPVVIGVDGFELLINSWNERGERMLVTGAVEKDDQFRLNKHLQNRLQPVQHYMQCLLTDHRVCSALGISLVGRAETELERMDAALRAMLKFGSLLVQLPNASSLGLYIKHLRKLRDIVVDYQDTNLEIQRRLTL
jgi:hypothetical protein